MSSLPVVDRGSRNRVPVVGEGSMSGVPAVGEGGNRSDVSDSALARTESGDPANNRSVTTYK